MAAVTAGQGGTAVPGTVGQALAGTLGTLTVFVDGTFSFVVAANDAVRALGAGETAVNRFTYTPTAAGVSDTPQTITVTVTGINDAPIALADTTSIAANTLVTSVTGNVRANDSDPDANTGRAQLTVTQVAAAGGAAQPLGTPISGTYGSLTLNSDGSYTYIIDNLRPATLALVPGTAASDVFTYTIADPQGATAATTLTVTINPTANEPPVALPDSNSIVTQSPVSFVQGNVRANDSDSVSARALLTVTQVSASGGGTAPIGTGLAGAFGTLTLAGDGSYVYTIDRSNPAVAALGTGDTRTDVFSYTIADPQGATATSTLTVTLNGAANTPPTAVPDGAAIVAQSVPGFIQGNVRANDSDSFTPRALLTVTAVAAAGGAPVPFGTPAAGQYGVLALNPDGTYVYTLDNANPATIALQPGEVRTDIFTYTIADQQGATASTTLTINVTGANDPPETTDDRVTFIEDGPTTTISGNVLANDRDPEGGALTVSALRNSSGDDLLVGVPNNVRIGTIEVDADGSYTIVLNNSLVAVNSLSFNAILVASFNYFASDTAGATTRGTLNATIIGANDAPTVRPDFATVIEDTRLVATGNLLANDRDPDTGNTIAIDRIATGGGTLVAVTTPLAGTYGSLTVDAAGAYTYTLNNSLPAVQALSSTQQLSETFDYRVTDGVGGRTTGTLTINIGGTDEPGLVLSFATPVSGAVTLSGSADQLFLANTATVAGLIDGGAGTDTLTLVDWPGVIRLEQIALGGIDRIETIVLGGPTATTLSLSGASVAALLPVDDVIRFSGGVEDRLQLDASFVQGSDSVVGAVLYHSYTSGSVTILVDGALAVIG